MIKRIMLPSQILLRSLILLEVDMRMDCHTTDHMISRLVPDESSASGRQFQDKFSLNGTDELPSG